jgi:hypothetical protein
LLNYVILISRREVKALGKNVYSLVLLDDVVDAVDQLACERSLSRSGLINQILAEYLSCPIPENRIHEIFTCMENRLSGQNDFSARWQPSESLFCIRTPLRYRYHPTVRYSLELYRESAPYFGEMRVSFRTQNSSLLSLSEAYFRCWKALEDKWAGPRLPGNSVPASAEPGKYTRKLCCPANENDRTGERIAEAVLAYIGEFDTDLKAFFAEADEPEDAMRNVENHYLRYLKKAVIL